MLALERLLENLALTVEPFALCQVSTGWRLRMDGLDWVTFHFVLAGRGRLTADSGRVAPLRPATLAVVPPGLAHTIETGPVADREATPAGQSRDADGLLQLVAGAAGDRAMTVACGRVQVRYAGALGLFDLLDDALVLDFSNSHEMRSIFERLLEEQRSPSLGIGAMATALMNECLVLVFRRLGDSAGGDLPWLAALSDPRLARALDVMLAHPERSHSVETLASESHMSRSVFADHFSACMGRPPMTFLRDVRIRRGAELLRATTLPVDAVARRVGYSSRSNFTHAFRAYFGEPPSQFRAGATPESS